VLNAPLPQPPAPPMTPEEMLAEMLAARRESTRALELVAQLVGGLVRGGQGEGGRQGDGAHGYDRPSTYHDFLKTQPPTFTPSVEPLDADHWLRTIEQKLMLLH
jgi:hypothetical protein